MDGLTVCRTLRAEGNNTPVLFLTARGDPQDRIYGLEAGGDDYLAKPFHLHEFLLRVRAILRRWEWYQTSSASVTGGVLRFGGNEVDFRAFKGRSYNGVAQELTEKEAMILKVLADPLAVDVVIRNLVENAIAAVAPVGGGTITLKAHRATGEIELSVRDTGVGFRPTDGARLFKKFSRLGAGGGNGGTGLGLFIVRRMMQLAGGRVTAHSDGVGQGAQFVLAWPIAPVETQ
jgi:signal transduction histidine kinase